MVGVVRPPPVVVVCRLDRSEPIGGRSSCAADLRVKGNGGVVGVEKHRSCKATIGGTIKGAIKGTKSGTLQMPPCALALGGMTLNSLSAPDVAALPECPARWGWWTD